MTLVTPRRGREAEAFLSAHPGLQSTHVVWTDMCGVQRGKILRRDEVAPAWEAGRFFPISALALDVTGQDVPETGLVWDEGDRDVLLWPVPQSLVRVPWSAEPAAQYIAHICDLDGTPHYADPRNLLARMVGRLAERGMRPVGAVELEFFLLDRDRALAGIPAAPRSSVSGAVPEHYQAVLPPGSRRLRAIFSRRLRLRRNPGPAGENPHLRICAGSDGNRASPSRRHPESGR